MRILHLWDVYSPGLFDRSHALCLVNGVESDLLCMHLLDRATPPGPRVTAVRTIAEDASSGFAVRAFKRLRRALDRRRFRTSVQNQIAKSRPDVIHFHFGTTAAMLEGIAGLAMIPAVVSFYGYDISAGLDEPSLRQAYERLLPNAAKVHILCEEARARAIALGAVAQRTEILNLPLDLAGYPLIGLAGTSVSHWLIPARFVAKKGHLVALDAFALHLNAHPDARLTCWGYGPDEWLRDAIAERGLSEKVSVSQSADPRGFDAAYREQLHWHDAVLAPSVKAASGDDEGGPALTAVLAQLSGKPVIYSDFPGSECSLTDNIEGFVVPQNDVAALASAMNRLASDPARASKMGLAGRTRVLSGFSSEAYWSHIDRWYRELAE
ncbi:MAG: glycosyltransferase family 4 protein [Sphingomonadales bacterium]|nr:glycosyltransferase family 4 protein [Sphingomonadales bacterium]